MKIWGIQEKYKSLSWWENHMGGHISFFGITIFGANAMCWTVQISTKLGYFCFTLPVIGRYRYDSSGKKWWQWYMYLSPNGTPWACTWYMGSDKNEAIRAKIRKINFGHGFNTKKHREALYAINSKYHSVWISEYDIYKYSPKEHV